MVISGIGIDIEEISRFIGKKFLENQNFYEKIFTKNEIKYCLSKEDPYPHFTARFCAKEALIKAIGNSTIKLIDIEVKNVDKKPQLQFETNSQLMLSISHTSKYAIAVVLIEE